MRKICGCGTLAGWGWLLVAPVVGVCAQTPGSETAAQENVGAVIAAPEIARDSREEVLRRIEDPSTGDIWLLLRDPGRPGGPGRLVLARERSNAWRASIGGPGQPLSAGERPVIRTGDVLTIEEHTAVADVRLEAVALESAAKGDCFKVRLKLGGKVVHAIAIAPGRAVFASESEAEP